MENRYIVNYDIKQKCITNIRYKQGDVDSSVLEVHLIDNGVAIPITGETIEFRFLKPDGKVVYQDITTGVTITDDIKGVVECVLKSNTLAVSGLEKCEIHRSKDGKELTTPSFYFTVESSIGADGILSTNYIGLIEDKVTGWQADIDTMKSAYDAATKANLSLEVSNARTDNTNNKTYDTLGARLDFDAAQLNDNTTKLSFLEQLKLKFLYGAKGDGVTDDTTAIQNAINDATTNNSYVYFPSGQFKHNALTVTCPLYGNKKSTTLLSHGIMTVQADNVCIKDLKIQSFVENPIYTLNTLYKFIAIDNVEFDWDSSITANFLAINSTYTENLKITNCKFIKGGIQLTRAYNFLIKDNYFDMQWLNNINEPIHASYHSKGIINGNTILNTNTDAIDIYSSGDRVIITNNRIIGVSGESCITLKVYYTDSANSSGSTLGWVESSIISNNIIKDYRPFQDNSRWYGIYARYLDDRSSKPAFTPDIAQRNLIIEGNIIEDFWIDNTVGYTNAYFAGIHFDGYGASIHNNVINNITNQGNAATASQVCGIELGFSSPSTGVKAVNCSVTGNVMSMEGSEIILYNVENCVFANNSIGKDYVNNRNPRYGLVFFGNVNYCTFEGNSFNLTFANPMCVNVSGGTISHCVFIGNISKSLSPCNFGACDHTTINSNEVGPITIGVDGTQVKGNKLVGNHIEGLDQSLPGINAFSQVGAIVEANTFKNSVAGVYLQGNVTNQDITNNCIVKDNISENQTYATVLRMLNISTASQATIINADNIKVA